MTAVAVRGGAEDLLEEAEDGDGFLDFKESSGTGRIDGDSFLAEGFLEAEDAGIHATHALHGGEEEGDLVVVGNFAFFPEAFDEAGDLGVDLVSLRVRGDDDGGSLVFAVRLDLLVDDAVVLCFVFFISPDGRVDESGVESDDALAGAVVGVEVEASRFDAEVLEAARFELDEIFDGGTAEAVESLVVVADDADVLVTPGELEEDGFLDGVGVLVLVDDDVLENASGLLRFPEVVEGPLLEEGEVDLLDAFVDVEALLVGFIHAEERFEHVIFGADRVRVEVFLREAVEERDAAGDGEMPGVAIASREIVVDGALGGFFVVVAAGEEEVFPVGAVVDAEILRELVEEERGPAARMSG